MNRYIPSSTALSEPWEVQCLSWWDPDPHLPALPHLRQVLKVMIRYIRSSTALSVSLEKYTVSQLFRFRPSPTSFATPTLGNKSDESIHSVACRAVCEPWGSLSQLMRRRPPPTSYVTPVLREKRWFNSFCVLPRCLRALEYSVSADETQTLTYQLCHTYARD